MHAKNATAGPPPAAPSNLERTLERVLDQVRAAAEQHAIRMLLRYRPDLTPPGGMPVVVPPDERNRVALDKLAAVAWFARQLETAATVEVSGALRAGASWSEIGRVAKLTRAETTRRYGHLGEASR